MKKFIWPIYLILLKKVDSTNQYAKKNIIKYKKNWTIILSFNQKNGKGFRNNYWITEKGKNLTFSIILQSLILPIHKGYIINVIISNAIHKILLNYNKNFWIKWPNDIFFKKKKIGGILIENNIFYKKIHTFIIGIGLNVNQTDFDNKINASSLKKILKKQFNLKKLLNKIIFSIQKEYIFFKNYGEIFIRNYYINNLYLKDKISFFYIYSSNYKKKIISGIIRNITKTGNIVIELYNNKKISFFSQKEIKLII
ncbi:biotin--[acetyl-CoA-carboxylase] ligase [Blattabacterium cuenoti]|uniref:biotin--[acetyl-CoA-carboxylase] ligase n=1 Tax=Blattabacterium cuenoti TaxID=1653831 RepID=UPI00163CC23B|nr:biotin--[acetyl-CoA-carboxylase] ligase [Blattabacterium cuenoti]